MNDPSIPHNIEKSVKRLGISSCMKGYTYLCRAVQLVCDDSEYFYCPADDLYMIIARENGTNAHCIERDIRTAIKDAKSCPYHGINTVSYYGISAKKLIFIIAETISSDRLLE